MKTWLTGLKLSRYGIQFKLQVGLIIFFLACGLIVEIASRGTNVLGGFYLVMSGLFIVQMILSAGQSSIVQTSPYRKKLETMVPAVCGMIFCLLGYTVCVLMQTYFNYSGTGAVVSTTEIGRTMVSCDGALLLVIMMLFFLEIYMGIAYKFFLVGMIAMILGLCTIMTANNCADFAERLAQKLGFGGVVAVGYAMILLGTLIEYALLCLLYKRPYSKYAFGSVMRRMR
jgi:hypothetical protein